MCRYSVSLVISIQMKIMHYRASICPVLIPFRKLKLFPFPFPQCRRLQIQDLLAHPQLDSILLWLMSSLFYKPMLGTMAMLLFVIVRLLKRLRGFAQKVVNIPVKISLRMYTKRNIFATLVRRKLAVHSGYK